MAFGDRPLIRITGGAMFCMFLIFLTGVLAWVYIKHPPSVLNQVLSGTSEERMLRNLQDPLAMRLWVLKEMNWIGDVDQRKLAIEAVIKQWSEEVRDLKDKAYHTKAADMSWNLKGLDLTEEQKKAVMETNKTLEQTSTVKQTW